MERNNKKEVLMEQMRGGKTEITVDMPEYWKDRGPNEIVNILDDMARSHGYLIIQNVLPIDKVNEIKKDPELYKLFQSIKMECKQSWTYDRKVSTMLDVNKACTNLYTVVLKLLNAMKNDSDTRLDEICLSINKIEEKLGMEKTVWNGGTDSAESNDGDVEGITHDNQST